MELKFSDVVGKRWSIRNGNLHMLIEIIEKCQGNIIYDKINPVTYRRTKTGMPESEWTRIMCHPMTTIEEVKR